MSERTSNLESRELEFERFIVAEYLKYCSVDELFRRNEYNLPISYPGVHRLLDRWGIIKAAGPNSKLSEAICFITTLSEDRIPLEKMYRKMPPSFQTSMSTMHRILHNIKEGVVRRVGTALVVVSENDAESMLVANDISTPRLELGKPFGSVSVPLTFSKEGEDSKDSILRVLQQEVFTGMVLTKKMPENIIPDFPRPFMYLDIGDVRVCVYKIILPRSLSGVSKFSSFKLNNFRFLHLNEILSTKINGGESLNLRSGVVEIAAGYLENLNKEGIESPVYTKSLVNLALSEAFAD